MSGGFGSLYYTDCRPGQGLQGGAGFQFQAASPGVTPEAMPLVQRTALYEPPVRWMRERRPVADYPPSLAHTAEAGLFATAAGCYLGQETNGIREGNQFTHAIVTRDPADYGMVRPAQLWRAPWWAVAPAPATELGELAAHPPPGPLDVETVCDRVRNATGGQARLAALLSAIHHLADPAHRRTVVLVCTDPEEAACWISAATLLLPRPHALQVSFKIFVADGQYGQHDIIALHPEWAGRWSDPGPGSGAAVFDLDRGRDADVEVTSAARFWVPRLLAEDPYDVVDAVELAGQFATAGALGQPASAERLAAVVVACGEPLGSLDQVQQVAGWLRTAPEHAVRIARDPVLAAVLAATPGGSELYSFAQWWVQQTDPGLEPERWHAPPEALDWVRDVLRAALAGPHPAQARAAVRARWWRPLWPDADDPADPLDAELMAVACEHLEGALAATHETAPAVLAVLSGCSDEVAKPLLENLMARWPRHAGAATASECRAVAFSFALATGRQGTGDMRDHLAKLAALVAAMPPGVRTAVERSYPGGLGQRWWDWVATVARSRWRLRRRSGTRSAARTGERSE